MAKAVIIATHIVSDIITPRFLTLYYKLESKVNQILVAVTTS